MWNLFMALKEHNKFFLDAVNQVEKETPETPDLVLIAPPTRGQDSDIE